MPDAVLIFTFSPIQSFISEARRTADLRVGSQILSRLAQGAAQAAVDAGATLIYPELSTANSAPNKIVVCTSWEAVSTVVDAMEKKFTEIWNEIQVSTQSQITRKGLPPIDEEVWPRIWQRQCDHFWETYWSAARIEHGNYAQAYQLADQGLAARKRTRNFDEQSEEGIKDALSGRRQALRTEAQDATVYWSQFSSQYPPSKLRPGEKLDAIGAIKRFSSLAAEEESRFPSTSTVASSDFLNLVVKNPDLAQLLSAYREKLEGLLKGHLFKARPEHEDWPYDGDLLYVSTLTPVHLKRDYGVELTRQQILPAIAALKELTKAAGQVPSSYYAILVLDGDNMGQSISNCLKKNDAIGEHQKFSHSLSTFAENAKISIANGFGALVYNGGDDVLALLPLTTAFLVALELEETFFVTMKNPKASIGMVIVHRGYPLSAALRSARSAEERAKKYPGKNMIFVSLLKRSGETVECAARPGDLRAYFELLVQSFSGETPWLSNRFHYDVAGLMRAVPTENDQTTHDIFASLIKYAIQRHRNKALPENSEEAQWLNDLPENLSNWAEKLFQQGIDYPAMEISHWIGLARFIASGGDE